MKMTNQQLIDFLRGEGFTAGETLGIIAEVLPSPIEQLTAKELKHWVKNWKATFKKMKKWKSILDEQQRKQDEENL